MIKISYVNKVKIIITAVVLTGLVIATLSSCSSRNGYGCKGNQSWNKMVKRINSQ